MKNYIKAIFIFVLITFMFSIQPSVLWGSQPTNYPTVSVKEYSVLIKLYNDNSNLQHIYDSYVELETMPLSFEEFCEVYNEVIESDMFIYFSDNGSKAFKNTEIILDDIVPPGIYTPYDRFTLRWKTHYENAVITVEYIRDELNLSYLEEGGYKVWAEKNYWYKDDYRGCNGCKRKLQRSETIVLNGKECELFWEEEHIAGIVYDSNKVITVNVTKTEDGEGKVTKNYVREFLSDLVFSEYIPPEGDGETGGEAAGVE